MKVNDNDSKAQEMTNSQAKRAERKKEAQPKQRTSCNPLRSY